MSYWPSPIHTKDPFTIGKEKLEIPENLALELRNEFQKIGPFFVTFLKTHILPKGENDDHVCGVEFFSLDKDNDIIFDGHPLELSKCGKAFLKKLPSLTEITEKRTQHKEKLEDIKQRYPELMTTITSWWDKGYIAVIFKE